jgi:hypothetical protein
LASISGFRKGKQLGQKGAAQFAEPLVESRQSYPDTESQTAAGKAVLATNSTYAANEFAVHRKSFLPLHMVQEEVDHKI